MPWKFYTVYKLDTNEKREMIATFLTSLLHTLITYKLDIKYNIRLDLRIYYAINKMVAYLNVNLVSLFLNFYRPIAVPSARIFRK